MIAKERARFACGLADLVGSSAVALFAVLVAVSGCGAPPPPVAFATTGSTMGTTYSVKVAVVPEGVSEDDIRRIAREKLDRVNALMSTYRDDSELSRFNASTSTDWFDVSDETVIVAAAAIELHRLTEGALDVTVGPLVDLWSFGPEGAPARVPSDDAIAAAKARCGIEHFEVRFDPPALKKALPDLEVDLSAIAKGFAVDAVAEALAERGIERYMVEVGGEVRAGGPKNDGSPWRIGIEEPVPGLRRAMNHLVGMENEALATSGDYRNFFEVDGARYSHIIDPRTGRPVKHELASVSVIAASCTRADGLATALLVLGPDAGHALAETLEVEALFLVRDGATIMEKPTRAFRAREGRPNPPAGADS